MSIVESVSSFIHPTMRIGTLVHRDRQAGNFYEWPGEHTSRESLLFVEPYTRRWRWKGPSTRWRGILTPNFHENKSFALLLRARQSPDWIFYPRNFNFILCSRMISENKCGDLHNTLIKTLLKKRKRRRGSNWQSFCIIFIF